MAEIIGRPDELHARRLAALHAALESHRRLLEESREAGRKAVASSRSVASPETASGNPSAQKAG